MTQGKIDTPLLDWRWPSQDPPLARNEDPQTSHLAGEHCAVTSRQKLCDRLYDLIVEYPGHIANWYETAAQIEGGWKRISDLISQGRAHYQGTAINPDTGRKCGRIYPGRGTE